MARELRLRFSYANVMASLAVFISLGGGAYALTIPRNSVGAKQLAKGAVTGTKIAPNAVTSPRVRDFSLLARDFKRGQLPSGPQGAPGGQGETGAAGPFPDVLPRGKTLRGKYAVRYTAGGGGEIYADAISFGFTFASAPVPHVITQGAVPPPECPGNAGNPQAQPGHLCIYESVQTNHSAPFVVNSNFSPGHAETFGADLIVASVGAGQGGSEGSWAATSP